ncbi:hypothetical protein ACFL45_01045 [Candidatus Neomarinimicrobiota bacterium]
MRGFNAIIPTQLVLGLALFMPGTFLPAQPAQLPFRSLDIGLQLAANTNREDIHHYWNSHPAFGGVVETPFYFGLARAGIQVHPFSAISSGAYDYTDSFIYLGWGFPLVQTRHIYWLNAINLGAHFMLFTNPESTNNDETEMGIGLTSQLKYRFSPRWSVALAYSYNRIFTWKRINLAYFSGGLNYRITTPDWLRSILE